MHRAVALQLQRERPVEFQGGGEQHRRRQRLAEHGPDGGRIVLVLEHLTPGGVEADDFVLPLAKDGAETLVQKLASRLWQRETAVKLPV